MDKTRAARHAEDKGSAAQNEGGTGPFEELEALMIQWRLETHAAVFVDLGVETVADLEYMQDSDVDALQIPKIAKRKMQSLLDWWRGQNTAASTQKSTKRHRVDPPGVAGGVAGRAVGGSAEGAGGHVSYRVDPGVAGGAAGRAVGGSAEGAGGHVSRRVDPGVAGAVYRVDYRVAPVMGDDDVGYESSGDYSNGDDSALASYRPFPI